MLQKKIERTEIIQYLGTLLIIGISIVFSMYIYHENNKKQEIRFELAAEQIVIHIENRMNIYKQVLIGGVGLFRSSNHVSRSEWKEFVNEQKLAKNFPGIQGVGYSQVVRPDEKESYIEAVRANGFPNFRIHPDGDRDIYTTIIYLEPFDKRNRRAFGYDMFSQETRHKAMATAIESGEPELSRKVRLLQEDGTDEQAGFLMYVPVYKSGTPLKTKEDKFLAVRGFVYAPFRAQDLMNGIAGSMKHSMDVHIYDGTIVNNSTLLSDSSMKEHDARFGLPYQKAIEIGRHKWTIEIHALESFIEDYNQNMPWLILFIGFIFSLFYFLFIRSLIIVDKKQHKYLNELGVLSLRNELALKAGTIGIWEWKYDDNTLLWDDVMYDIYGVNNKDKDKSSPFSMWSNAIDPNDKNLAEQKLFDAMDNNTEYNVSYRIITPFGKRKYIHSIGKNVFDEFSKINKMVGVNIDNTELEEQNRMLQEQKTILSQQAQIIKQTHDSVISTDLDGNILTWNPGSEVFFEYKEAEAIGKHISMVYRKEDLKKLSSNIETLMQIGAYSSEIQFVTKSKKIVWGSISLSLLKDNSGKPMQMIGYTQDITESKKKDEIMVAQSRHAAMGEMISMIAHQWRQPITSIAMEANNMLADIELESVDEKILKKNANNIIYAIQELSKTIDDFRNFFRPGKTVEEVLPEDILNEAFNVIGASLKHHGIEVIIDSKYDKKIKIYSRELMQVLINILKNAKEVLVDNEIAKAKILVYIEDSDDEVIITICDNGGGIDDDIKDQIFDPYFSTKNKKNGTGLGLYMSRTIVEKHLHGEIDIYNKDGGACFVIRIPQSVSASSNS